MKTFFGYLSFLVGSVEPRSLRIPPYSYSSLNTSVCLHIHSPFLFRYPWWEACTGEIDEYSTRGAKRGAATSSWPTPAKATPEGTRYVPPFAFWPFLSLSVCVFACVCVCNLKDRQWAVPGYSLCCVVTRRNK